MIKEIRLLIWFAFGLLLGGYTAVSHAALQWSAWTPSAPETYCPSAFVSSGAGGYGWSYLDFQIVNTPTGQTANCRAKCTNSSLCGAQYNQIGGYGATTSRTASCDGPGEVYSDGICTSQCQSGQPGSASWWNGCFDVDGIDNGCDAGSRLPYPTAGVCDGSCVVSIGQWTSCHFPATGGGPIICDGVGTLTGQTCQHGDNYIPPNSLKCPVGYAIGTVNGKNGCYKSGSTDPVNTTTTQSTDPQTNIVTTTTTTTNTTNNTSTTTTTVYNPANSSTTTTQQTSPLDPNKPRLDEKSPGENQEPFEIDETGTPTDGSLSQAKSEFETAANAHKTFIDGLATQGNHGMTWDWTFELPSGSCSAYIFTIAGKSFTLDPCEKLGMIRDALGFLIYITTALALLSIATGYGKEGK